ncbi:MAG: ferritin family protein [Chloroflexi bacterium]|nr:ferritin family protein [Chloroflexota bacterium]
MGTSNFNALEAVNVALQMESSGREFYIQAAELTRDENGKTMLLKLANDELAHIYWLMTVRQSLLKTGQFGDIEQVVKEDVPSDVEETAVFPLLADGHMVTPDARELDVLEMGIRAEIDATSFYEGAAESTEDSAGRSLFKHLAGWEAEHRQLLEAERDYLTNNGFYMGLAEFQLEGPEYLSWWRR